MLNINKTIEDGKAVFSLAGRLDTVTAPAFENELKDSLKDVRELTIDCAELEYISSAGLRVLLAAQKVMSRQGEMKLVNVNDTGRTAFSSLSFTSNAGAFDIDLNGAGEGMATIVNNSGNKQIVRGCVNTGALAKSGSKEVELVDPVIGGKLTMANAREAENGRAMAAYAGECVALISRPSSA